MNTRTKAFAAFATAAALTLLPMVAHADELPEETVEVVETPAEEIPAEEAPIEETPVEVPVEETPEPDPTTPEPPVDAPAPVEPAPVTPDVPAPAETPQPIIVEAAPRVPIFNDPCGTANDSWADPGNTPDAPWQYDQTAPVLDGNGEIIDQGYVYAFLPDTHVMPNGNRTWYPVWEKSEYFTDAPCPIEGPPPAPIFTDPCGADNVVVTLPQSDIWLYEVVRDEVGGSGQVLAFVPEGFVIAGQGGRFWDPVFEFRDSQVGCPPAVPTDPGGVSPGTPTSDVLAATGPADMVPAGIIAAMFLGLGVILFTRRRRTN